MVESWDTLPQKDLNMGFGMYESVYALEDSGPTCGFPLQLQNCVADFESFKSV